MPENMTKITRYSDYGPEDDKPELMPMFNPVSGERITDLYTWHAMNAWHALVPEIGAQVQAAVKNGERLYISVSHYLEREGADCRAVVVADIVARERKD